jgi:hypothetical protein
MKKVRGDKPMGVIIHYMKLSQGNSLCTYLYLKQVKMSLFSLFLFSSIKSGNRRTEQILQGLGGLAPVGGDRCQGKRVGG